MEDAEPAVVEAELELGLLKKCLEVVTAVVDEGRVKITDGGVSLRVVDPANVALVLLELEGEGGAFVRYQWEDEGEGEDEVEVGVDFGRLAAVLKGQGGGRERDGEVVEALVSRSRLKLRIGNRISFFEYTLRLLDPSSLRKPPKIPELEFPCVASVDAASLLRAVKAAGRVADHVTVGVGDDRRTLFVAAEGYDEAVRAEFDDENAYVDAAAPAASKFSVKYLEPMLGAAARAADVVTLHLGGDIPLRLDFEFDGCRAAYLLAPRIEVE